MSQTWVVIGDSISSYVAQGVASQHYLHLLAAEKNIVFKNLSCSMHALGATDNSGFHSDSTRITLEHLDGFYGVGINGIIVQAGTNDHGRNINWGDTYNSLVRILTFAQSRNKKVLVLDPIWKDQENAANASGWNLNTYRYFMQLATNNYPAVARFCHRENSIIGTSAGAGYFDQSETPYRTHLVASGHRVMADWIKAEAAAQGWF